MADQRWMAACYVDSVTFRSMQLGHRRDDAHADADSLVIGQLHDAREAAVVLLRDHWHGRTKIHRDAVPCGQEISCGDRERAAQIVMALKQLPRVHRAAMDFQ